MLDNELSAKVLRCTTLVARQRRMVARLREGSDPRTLSNAERLLRSFERSLIAILKSHRRRRDPRSVTRFTPARGAARRAAG